MRVLVFAGAGASVELGVPAMLSMMHQLVSHLSAHGIGETVLSSVRTAMTKSYFDIEDFIAMLDGLAATAGSPIADQLSEVLHREGPELRAECEWFVQYVCERVRDDAASAMWGDALAALPPGDAVIATTNYDRAIELAATSNHLPLVDGFAAFDGREWAQFANDWNSDGITLLKLHGSTDWYRHQGHEGVLRLRHPMPLFGGVALRLDDLPHQDLRNAVILPSREKFKTETPFSSLMPRFYNAVQEAELCLFVGTSLRDPDIKARAAECAGIAPTFVVAPSRPDALNEMASPIQFIAETASRFLLSTLPAAFASGDPVAYFTQAGSGSKEVSRALPVLDLILQARDTSADLSRRIQAIESLAGARVSLRLACIEHLLNDDEQQVRIYALALVSLSPDTEDLMVLAARIAESADMPEFTEELSMLEKLRNSGSLA